MSVTRVQLVGNVSTGASFVGVVTATSFSGSGANLTGIAATDNVRTNSLVVSGVSTLGNTIVGTAVTINSSGINVTGVITATSFVGSGANLTGVSTLGTVVVGGATTQLIVVGDARVTGILTIGTGSITLNGSTNIINVGTGLTLSSSGIVAGVITATSFVGSGANLTGIANTANIRSDTITVGVLTATSINVPPVPIVFSPAIGATNVGLSSNIIITFNVPVAKGTGNITLRENSANGTAFSTIAVGNAAISGGAVTIDPPSPIGTATTTFVVVDAGAFSAAVGVGSTTSINALINTYSFTTLSFTLSSINPANAATNVAISTNVTLTFNIPPERGTGTITLRSGSTSGSVIETFDAASSGRISVSGNDWILDPTSNLGFSTSIHTIIPSTAIVGYVGLNTAGADTHSFTTAPLSVGDSYEGGFLICKASPLRWVVSPRSAEVSRNWYARNDASGAAQSVSGCTGWFVPTRVQLQNPGYCCRSFWGPSPCYSPYYWSSTDHDADNNIGMNFDTGVGGVGQPKQISKCVRAFRCVTY